MRGVTLIAFAALSITAFSQTFSITTNFQSFGGPSTANDIPSPNWSPTIHNISGDTITLRWVRAEENIPGWWRSSICTELYCYSIPDDSATWSLLPGDSDMINIHIYPYGNADTGNVVIKLFNVDNPSDSVRIMFHCDVATGIEEHNVFTFLHANLFSHDIRYSLLQAGTVLLSDMNGRILYRAEVQASEISTVHVTTSGVYFFTFIDAVGNVQIRKLML